MISSFPLFASPFANASNEALTVLIVIGGMLLATLLRCGWGQCRAALAALGGLILSPWRPAFDGDRVRSQLAVQVQQIGRDGLLRARPRPSGDAEFDEATDALIVRQSLLALVSTHDNHRSRRLAQAETAVCTLLTAAELAPVAGLAGTLVSLSRLPADGIDRVAYLVAIGMAVHATLYGLIAAHLVLVPLARAVERAALREEGERQGVVDWLTERLSQAGVEAPKESRRESVTRLAPRARHG